MKKLLDLHKVKIKELKRKYEMPEDLEEVMVEDNTMHPYIEAGLVKMYLPLRKMRLK